MTSKELKNRFSSDLLPKSGQEDTPSDQVSENLVLEPILTSKASVPEGWKDAVYGRDGSGSANKSNDW